MRSRTCRSSCSRAGKGVPRCASSLSTGPTRSDSSNCVMTSLFTTATMRSTSSVFAGAGAAGAVPWAKAASGHRMASSVSILVIRATIRLRSVKGARRLIGRLSAQALVARDVALQRFEGIRPYPGKAVQLQLKEQRARRRARGQGEVLDHDARDPATGIVFDPGERFDDPLVASRIVEATHAVPAAAQRPLRRNVGLRDLVAQVAVAEVER